MAKEPGFSTERVSKVGKVKEVSSVREAWRWISPAFTVRVLQKPLFSVS